MFWFEGGSDGKVAGCGWVRAWVGTIGGDVGVGVGKESSLANGPPLLSLFSDGIWR